MYVLDFEMLSRKTSMNKSVEDHKKKIPMNKKSTTTENFSSLFLNPRSCVLTAMDQEASVFEWLHVHVKICCIP